MINMSDVEGVLGWCINSKDQFLGTDTDGVASASITRLFQIGSRLPLANEAHT